MVAVFEMETSEYFSSINFFYILCSCKLNSSNKKYPIKVRQTTSTN